MVKIDPAIGYTQVDMTAEEIKRAQDLSMRIVKALHEIADTEAKEHGGVAVEPLIMTLCKLAGSFLAHIPDEEQKMRMAMVATKELLYATGAKIISSGKIDADGEIHEDEQPTTH